MGEFISTQGRKALDQVATWLENGAPHVDIDGRRIDDFNMKYAVNEGSCGTSCCVAGAVVQFEKLGVLHDGDIYFDEDPYNDSGAGKLAQDYLGINDKDARALFLPWDNDELVDKHPHLCHNASPFSDTAVAAKTIRNYLATGDIDWVAAGLDTEDPDSQLYFDED